MSSLPANAWRNCDAMTISESIRDGACFMHEYGAKATVAVVPWRMFERALTEQGGSVAFPAPGVFVQTPSGWILLLADERLNHRDDGYMHGWLRDGVTGEGLRLRWYEP